MPSTKLKNQSFSIDPKLIPTAKWAAAQRGFSTTFSAYIVKLITDDIKLLGDEIAEAEAKRAAKLAAAGGGAENHSEGRKKPRIRSPARVVAK